MSWLNALNDIVQRYSGQGAGASPAGDDPHHDYQQVTQSAPPEVVADGLSQAFRSDRTPAFPERVSNLFSHSDPNQRAGLLNKLLGALGPGALGSLGSLGMGSNVTPQQATELSPQ